MAKRGDPEVLRLVAGAMRLYARMKQGEFGTAARIDQSDISRYELGKGAVPEESLRRMAAAAGLAWTDVVHLRRVFTAILSMAHRRTAGIEAEAPLAGLALDSALLAVTPYLIETGVNSDTRPPEVLRREAEEAWVALAPFPLPQRGRLLALAPRAARTPALVAVICEASVQAACHKTAEARELAELALFLARRLPGKRLRLAAEGFCWAFIANALRVATEFDEADRAFVRAWELWRAGAPGDPDFLPEWRLLDLEASLRREQHRFDESLKMIDSALAASGVGSRATGRLLMKKAHVLERLGNPVGSLSALEDARPAIQATQDPHLFLRLQFNTAVNLAYLERFEEAEKLLPEITERAGAQARELDGTRVAWLVAKVDAGRGREEEAKAGLERVIRDFTALELAYEAALASLDLAVLYLKEGRTAEVQRLAVAMGWIFKAKGIAREALAALALFCEAAQQETATIELAKRVIAKVESAQRSATASK